MRMNRARRSGGDGTKRERTRAALIEAAIALIGERGYEATSLEAVARRAGMSRGAIYGNFANREALFLAVAEALWRPLEPPFVPGVSLCEEMRILGRTVAAAVAARRSAAVGALSFQLYALTHETLRARLVERNRETYG